VALKLGRDGAFQLDRRILRSQPHLSVAAMPASDTLKVCAAPGLSVGCGVCVDRRLAVAANQNETWFKVNGT
jgi:hypothetical protein